MERVSALESSNRVPSTAFNMGSSVFKMILYSADYARLVGRHGNVELVKKLIFKSPSDVKKRCIVSLKTLQISVKRKELFVDYVYIYQILKCASSWGSLRFN